jgi:apolipoprotein N-acyltransferase
LAKKIESLPVRLFIALVGSALAYLVFPRTGIWILLYPMLALVYLAGRGLRFWKATLVGLVSGITFFASQTFWLSQYLGPEPLIVLAGGEGLIFAVFFGASSWTASRLGPKFCALYIA